MKQLTWSLFGNTFIFDLFFYVLRGKEYLLKILRNKISTLLFKRKIKKKFKRLLSEAKLVVTSGPIKKAFINPSNSYDFSNSATAKQRNLIRGIHLSLSNTVKLILATSAR